MDKTKAIRMARRITAMVIVAFVLAILPFTIGGIVRETFFLTDDGQSFALRYQQSLLWCHIVGIAAMFILNLIFLLANEKRGDSGSTLQRRNTLQNSLNFLLLAIVFLAMVVFRYAIDPSPLIGEYISGATVYILRMLSPYGLFLLAGVIFWIFCMFAVPATNNAVRSRPWRKSDDKIKRAEKTRK